MNDEKWRENMDLPFHSPEEREDWYEFECSKYGKEDEVPGFVIDEFAIKKIFNKEKYQECHVLNVMQK
jgi:hypothetical protein